MDWLSACQIIVFPIALDIIGFHLNYQLLGFYFLCELRELILTLSHKGHGLFCISLTGEGGAFLLLVTGSTREAPSALPWPLYLSAPTFCRDMGPIQPRCYEHFSLHLPRQYSVRGHFQASWPSPCCIHFHKSFLFCNPVLLVVSCVQRSPDIPHHVQILPSFPLPLYRAPTNEAGDLDL